VGSNNPRGARVVGRFRSSRGAITGCYAMSQSLVWLEKAHVAVGMGVTPRGRSDSIGRPPSGATSSRKNAGNSPDGKIMEHLMQTVQLLEVPKRRLRIFYRDTTVSLGLADNATFEDIARKMDELPNRGHGDPVAIDVSLRAVSSPILFI
jgi:hypothetical protein